MSLIAFAATASNLLGADAGIIIRDAGIIIRDDADADVLVIDGDPGEDEFGNLDTDNADAILASHGFALAGSWTRSDGQWAAEVERSA
jgi:hypothetical protein